MRLDVHFEENERRLKAEFSANDFHLSADLGEIHIVKDVGEAYKGDYDVTPKVGKQVMPTKHKYMVDDVTINPVPIFEVSNTSGGNTVYIAEEM